jgi:hypothetical protein
MKRGRSMSRVSKRVFGLLAASAAISSRCRKAKMEILGERRTMETHNRNVPRRWLTYVGALVLFAVGGNIVWADSGPDTVGYLIAPPGADVSAASNGDTIQMAGTGTLFIHEKSVAGGGTFTQNSSAGAVIATGTWTAIDLLSFDDYGTTPGFPIAGAHGGDALMRVHLTPNTGGPGVDAILEVQCILGNPPPGHDHEGIQLAVQGGGPNFNKIITGSTVFIDLT